MSEELTSITQDHWKEIVGAVREQIAKQVPLMPAMNPTELSSFVHAVGEAMWQEVKSEAYDAQVAEMKASLLRSAAYGG